MSTVVGSACTEANVRNTRKAIIAGDCTVLEDIFMDVLLKNFELLVI
jgi:hypothetical protein